MTVNKTLSYPEIPEQRRFTIGEACELCNVKPHVLRYWEIRYSQLKKVERRNNRRYYTTEDLITIRTINDLKSDFTSKAISEALATNKAPGAAKAQIIKANKIREEIESIVKTLE